MEDNKEQEINEKSGETPKNIPEPIIKNGRIIKYNEKAITDHLKLFSIFMSRGHVVEQLNNPHLMERIDYSCLIEGHKITIDATVKDSLFSSLLMTAMYGKSDFDDAPLLLAGLEINSISFKGATHFNDNELSVIMAATEILKNKLNPNNDGQQ